MTTALTPAVSFIARSGTGKTTLVTKLISELKSRGYKVGAIKHDAHKFEIDHPGKDSYRFTESGVDTMLISSNNKLALVKQYEQPPQIAEMIRDYFSDVDIVLVEGFKRIGLPKIEVHRKGHGDVLLCRGSRNDPSLLAVATDSVLDLDVPLLDLNRPTQVVDFLVQTFALPAATRGSLP